MGLRHLTWWTNDHSFKNAEFSTRFYDFIEIYFIFILVILIFFISSLRKEFTKKLKEDNYKNLILDKEEKKLA